MRHMKPFHRPRHGHIQELRLGSDLLAGRRHRIQARQENDRKFQALATVHAQNLDAVVGQQELFRLGWPQKIVRNSRAIESLSEALALPRIAEKYRHVPPGSSRRMKRPRTLDDVRKFRLLARKAAKLGQRAAAARALRRNERDGVLLRLLG